MKQSASDRRVRADDSVGVDRRNRAAIDDKQHDLKFPIPLPPYRFDQKNEVFKRARWDAEVSDWANRLYTSVKYQDRAGYRQQDYALRNAAWNLEYDVGWGNSRSNAGLYSWSHVTDKIKLFIKAGKKFRGTPEENSRLIKQAARFLGADLVGICQAHPRLIYSHEYNLFTREHYPLELPEGHNHAIVIAIEMDYETVRYSPTAIAGAATGMGYSKMAMVANAVANFVRGLGYDAAPSGNDTALSIPLAIAAGLGELGRMGLLVTKEYGPRVRLCKVFTNMLLAHDTYQPFGVTEFCRICKKCAKHCPSQAVALGEPTMEGQTVSNHSGVSKWYINPEKCFRFWVKNYMDCNNCVRVCPFNKPPGIVHDATRAVIGNMPFFNRLFIWLDDLLGYGKILHPKEYWPMHLQKGGRATFKKIMKEERR